MEQILDPAFYAAQWEAARTWLAANALLLSVSTLAQVTIVAAAFLLALAAKPRIQAAIEQVTEKRRYEAQLRRVAAALAPLSLPIIWLLLLWLAERIADQAGLGLPVVTIVVSLLAAWVVIRLTASLVRDPVWSQLITLVAWAIAALNILGLLRPAMIMLDSVAISLGDLRISALTIVRSLVSLAVLLWLAALAGRLLERRIVTMPNLTPSLQVLIVKLLRIFLVAIAVVAALRTVGIDLTAFAVLTGAIGVGIGFGLQKAVSNFISGVSILMDKSIKPGDVISVGETYGWVSSLRTRYVSVITRDGTEYLIPNEKLFSERVINWTYSTAEVRLKLPIGISYRSDLRQAIELCQAAARDTPRVLSMPKPLCLVKGFGENGIELELRIWIDDPRNGISNVKSDVYLRIWDSFRAVGIEIPFPQRDLHLKTPPEIRIVSRNGSEPPPAQDDDAPKLGLVMP